MSSTTDDASDLTDREMIATRVFDAPRERVWEMWTRPQHIARWWGPRGFTTTTAVMDVKPGGVWQFVMHGPDGTDYPNRITYVEVVEPQRLVYEHRGEKDVEPVKFTVTVTFEARGEKTFMTMRMRFPSAGAKQFTIDKYGADKGLVETVARLEEELAKRADG